MAGSKSNYLENELLDHVLGDASYSAPGTLYIALYTVATGDSDSGTEVSGNGYVRLAVTNNATNFPAASAGAKANGVAFTFATASGGNWGTVVAFGIYDSSTSTGTNNLLYWADLTVSKSVDDGDTAQFNIGDLDVTED